MQFVFDEQKTTQAAAYLLLKFHQRRHNLMALLKLLYLADRRALAERGYPITGDDMVSMPQGPVLSQTLDLINCGSIPGSNCTDWSNAISPRDGYDIGLVQDPGVEALSEFETDVLDKVHEQFGHLDQWQLRDFTHTLPEWEDPHGSMRPINPVTILRESGFEQSEIQLLFREVRRWSSLAERC